ncbi:hypothetical protein LUX34_03160 [Streptomyces werraensis]|nr:hypothetical protein [Streptomyces werraensis]
MHGAGADPRRAPRGGRARGGGRGGDGAAVAHAYGGSFTEATLPRAVGLALAPDWLATSAAIAAALLALAALVVRVATPPPGTRWSPWPPAEPHQVTD